MRYFGRYSSKKCNKADSIRKIDAVKSIKLLGKVFSSKIIMCIDYVP